MPRGKKTYVRKPKYRRRPMRRMRRTKISTTRVKNIFGSDRLKVKLKYTYIGSSLNTVSDDFNYNLFALNTPVDPGLLQSSNNATGYSTYAAMYQNYYCAGSAIKVQVVNMDIDVPMRLSVVPLPREQSQALTSTTDANVISNPYAKTRILGNATGGDRSVIKHFMTIRKLTGKPDANSSDEDLIGDTTTAPGGSNTIPNTTFQWFIGVQALTNVTDNIDTLLSVEITYYIEFFNRAILQ